MGLELGRLVQNRRHELGLSRRDLADRSEVSYPYISQIETGDRDPSLRTLRKLAETLDLPLEELAMLVSQEAANLDARSTPAAMSMSPAPMRARARSREDSVDLYREKVMPSVERRLASIPPLVRLTLLNELVAAAIEELRDSR